MVAREPLDQSIKASGKGALAAPAHGRDPPGGHGCGYGELSEMREFQAKIHRRRELQVHQVREDRLRQAEQNVNELKLEVISMLVTTTEEVPEKEVILEAIYSLALCLCSTSKSFVFSQSLQIQDRPSSSASSSASTSSGLAISHTFIL